MNIRARAIQLALLFAFLFSCVAVLQFFYVRHQIYETARTELISWADELADAAVVNRQWDIQGYRNMAPMVPNSCVITSEGLIIDIEGFIHGLIPPVEKPNESIYQFPQPKISPLGEKWLLFARRLSGGCVIVGVSNPDELKRPAEFLIENAERFGATVDEAAKVSARGISENVDYAVISDSGDLQSAWGGIPLKTDASFVSNLATRSPTVIEGKSYIIVSKMIYDGPGKAVGTVIVPKDMSPERRALHDQIVFDSLVAGVSWLVFLLVPLSYLVFDEVKRRQQQMTIEEALRTGENQVIEFKRGFIADALAREIAAFANTNPGNIFLGIDDSGRVVGLNDTDPYQRGELLRKIRDITSAKISPRVVTETAFLTYEDKIVLRIFVPRGDQPLYAVEGLFYIRQQNSAEKATPQQIVAIVNRFAH